ncbi:hypothetical protein Pyn_00019 [Prunus yedoensis var. nudiflora]|uniref:Uncharacterized protein n=1 Tax=Prunus yedoensis var. nudiflora TaxID=2094558 RepID=A0A314V0K9_PRUYE|nr:hypothetical protein Pyn_00019 [Prunus yedoensis var. nudiflora]
MPPKSATSQNPKPQRRLRTHQINHLFQPHLHRHNYLISFSLTLAEIDCLSGYDFVVVDMEHDHGVVFQALPASTPQPLLKSPPFFACSRPLQLGPRKP